MTSNTVFFVSTFRIGQTNEKSYHRTPGYFSNIEDARKCVLENWGDIYELGTYNHALIEEVEEGLYPHAHHEKNEWYKVEFREVKVTYADKKTASTGAYEVTKIDTPEQYRHSVGFAIG